MRDLTETSLSFRAKNHPKSNHDSSERIGTAASENDSSAAQSLQREYVAGPSNGILIDNTANVYIPVRLKCGVRALCQPQVLSNCPGALADLNRDLVCCLKILPRNLHHLIRRTNFWINITYRLGAKARPKILNHTTAHHDKEWLVWARDRPDKALGIEIYNCEDYQRMRLHWNGCGLILHELAHLIHQIALPDGLENATVKEAFAQARSSDLYEQVLRRDWAGKDVDCDMAYAMVDHREFFAEMSVSYWSKAYPELDKAVHSRMEKASPPIVAPSVHFNLAQSRTRFEKWCEEGILVSARKATAMSHCNKFYPFTSGQLRHFDSRTYAVMERIWTDVAEWSDPMVEGGECCIKCWNPQLPRTQNAIQMLVHDTVDL